MRGWSASGGFYELKGYPMRRVLDVKANGCQATRPQLMVVMMNPGSSRPSYSNYYFDGMCEAIPDKTQEQIINVCEQCNVDYFRVLNLSDLREPNSAIFLSKPSDPKFQNLPHSIFHPQRKAELEANWEKGVPAVFGWGVDSKLEPLAKSALTSLNIPNPIGWQRKLSSWAYYHPLQRSKSRKDTWINILVTQLRFCVRRLPV